MREIPVSVEGLKLLFLPGNGGGMGIWFDTWSRLFLLSQRDILWLTYTNSPKGTPKFTKNAYLGQYLPIYTTRRESPLLFEKSISISVLFFSCLMNADGAWSFGFHLICSFISHLSEKKPTTPCQLWFVHVTDYSTNSAKIELCL